MPPGHHHHHVYDPGHGGKERNVLRKSYDYVPGVGVGTTGIVGGGGGARGGVGMTRGGTYVAVPPGYSGRVVDVRVRFLHLSLSWVIVVLTFYFLRDCVGVGGVGDRMGIQSRSTTPSKQPPHRPLLKRIFTSFKN